jgi:rhodanese-related sulfurtransferase
MFCDFSHIVVPRISLFLFIHGGTGHSKPVDVEQKTSILLMLKPLFLTIFASGMLLFSGCNQQPKELKSEQTLSSSATTVANPDFEVLLAEQPAAQLIDVRTAAEFNTGHLSKAVNIDFYSRSFMEQMGLLNKAAPVFVYCAVGGRSAEAARLLQQEGFKQVIDLQGGIMAWQKSGQKVVLE